MINLILVFVVLQLPVHHVSGTHATIYYPENVSGSVAQSYLSLIDQVYGDATGKLEVAREGGLKVRLCHDRYDFSDLTGRDSIFSPLWNDGTLYILCSQVPGDSAYRQAVEAGVMLGLLSDLRENGAPWWLINSAAIYESGEYNSCSSAPGEAVEYFSDLNEKIESVSSAAEMSNLCFCLGTTGKFFDSRFGVGSLVKLLQEFKDETSFDDAVKNLFHIDREQLEVDWREFLSNEANLK